MRNIFKEDLNMKYKHIEASREVRLWIGQIIVPAITLAATTMTIPEVREAVAAKANEMKRNIENKFKKDWAIGSFFLAKYYLYFFIFWQ